MASPVMVNLPKNLPDEIINYCLGCKTNDEVLDKLEKKLDFLISFFETASKDEDWCTNCPKLVERMNTFLDVNSVNEGLTLDQARHINTIAKSRFASASSLGKNNVKLNVVDPQQNILGTVEMNKLLLMVGSRSLRPQLGSGIFSEGAKKEIDLRYLRVQDLNMIKEFLETGKITNAQSLELQDLIQMIHAADFLEMPGLVTALCKDGLKPENLLPLLDLAYKLENSELRDACFDTINKEFRGLKISAKGFKDLQIDIFKCQTGYLKPLAPILNFFNPASKKEMYPNYPKQCELSLTLKTGSLPFFKGDLKELATELPWLSHLNASKTWLDDDAMNELTSICKNLKSANLSNCSVTDKTLELLADNSKALEALDLSETGKCTEAGFSRLAAGCTALRQLLFARQHGLTNENIQEFVTLCPNLNAIKIFLCNEIDNAGVAILAQAGRFQSVTLVPNEERTVDFMGAAPLVTDTQLQALATANPNLSYFELRRNNPGATADGLDFLIQHCTHLTRLNFENQPVNAQVLSHLGDLRELEDVELFGVEHIPEEDFANLAKCANLKSFEIDKNFSEDFLINLVNSCTHLRKINLQKVVLSGQSTKVLNAIINKLSELEKLDLGKYAMITEQLPNLSSLKNLKRIKFGGYELNRINENQLAQMLQGCTNLESINFREMDLTKEGLESIGRQCPNLKNVDLRCKSISLEAIFGLANVCRNIETINLPETGLQLQKKEYFARIANQFPFLKELFIPAKLYEKLKTEILRDPLLSSIVKPQKSDY